MVEILLIELFNICFYAGVDVNILERDALKKNNYSATLLPLFFADFNSYSESILQLQLQILISRFMIFLDLGENPAGVAVEQSRNKTVDLSMHFKAQSKTYLFALICQCVVAWSLTFNAVHGSPYCNATFSSVGN